MWRKSRLLVSVIATFVLGYLVLAYCLFEMGLGFVSGFPGLGTVLTERLLYLLFAFLFGLLLLSMLIISHTNFFRNHESAFLRALPIPHVTVFRWKFIESVVLASWAFLFLVAPLLLAFGISRGVPWHFYLVTLVLTAMLIVVPGVGGAWLALHLARYLDRRSFQVLLLLGGVALLALFGFIWKAPVATEEMLESRVLVVLDQLLSRTKFSMFPFLPSYQLTTGILDWAEGTLFPAAFYMLVLLSNTLLFGSLAMTRFGRLFHDSACIAQGRSSLWGRWDWLLPWRTNRNSLAGPARLERWLSRLPGIRPETATLLHKDILLFWRDTAQWGQIVVLFGLLGAYVINLRHFTHQITNPFWADLVEYLNLGTCSLTLATLTTRFVFPQFSLEGQRLWILGLAPMGLERVVRVKYWLASAASMVVTISLIVLSSRLLKLDWEQVLFFGLIISVMTLALNGLAIGLGVLYPNFKDPSAGKIVSGFGGTLCLVLSFVYILASVMLLAVASGGIVPETRLAVAALGLFGVLSVLTGMLPLHMAKLRLQRLEY